MIRFMILFLLILFWIATMIYLIKQIIILSGLLKRIKNDVQKLSNQLNALDKSKLS
jgi:hypothetical protein